MANLNIVIPIPKPKTKAATTVTNTGTPTTPPLKKPKQPAGVSKTVTIMKNLISKVQKVVGVLQNAQNQAHAFAAKQTITLKIKQGGTVVFEKQVAPLSTLV